MARISYPPEVRSAFISAAHSARSAGKSWAEALEAAEAAGYKGSEQSLYQLMLRTRGDAISAAGEPSESSDALQRDDSADSPTPGACATHCRFEYKTLILTTQLPPDAALNERGLDGWTLVAATPVSTALHQEGSNVTRIQYVLQRETQTRVL